MTRYLATTLLPAERLHTFDRQSLHSKKLTSIRELTLVPSGASLQRLWMSSPKIKSESLPLVLLLAQIYIIFLYGVKL